MNTFSIELERIFNNIKLRENVITHHAARILINSIKTLLIFSITGGQDKNNDCNAALRAIFIIPLEFLAEIIERSMNALLTSLIKGPIINTYQHIHPTTFNNYTKDIPI